MDSKIKYTICFLVGILIAYFLRKTNIVEGLSNSDTLYIKEDGFDFKKYVNLGSRTAPTFDNAVYNSIKQGEATIFKEETGNNMFIMKTTSETQTTLTGNSFTGYNFSTQVITRDHHPEYLVIIVNGETQIIELRNNNCETLDECVSSLNPQITNATVSHNGVNMVITSDLSESSTVEIVTVPDNTESISQYAPNETDQIIAAGSGINATRLFGNNPVVRESSNIDYYYIKATDDNITEIYKITNDLIINSINEMNTPEGGTTVDEITITSEQNKSYSTEALDLLPEPTGTGIGLTIGINQYCKKPEEFPEGVNPATYPSFLKMDPELTVNGSCSSGYIGTPVYISCSGVGMDYNVSGCMPSAPPSTPPPSTPPPVPVPPPSQNTCASSGSGICDDPDDFNSSGNCSGSSCTKEECCETDNNMMMYIGLALLFCIIVLFVIAFLYFVFKSSGTPKVKPQSETPQS
mgnify:CR=1 FL=1|tara:strand:+ start:165 stop:1559 length:1395 start_codon:yes stop_codon:yes gene_type:complete